jgi:o-succinylbenzoate synthase
MSRYRVEVTPYARPFRQPLQTSHGVWSVREGAIVTLTDADGNVGQGEIATLEWFGTESLGAAIEFCAGLDGWITTEQIFGIPDRFPCCQFGFESAHVPPLPRGARGVTDWKRSPPIAALLPTGQPAIDSWQSHYDRGHHTFKWKIGVSPIADEIQWFHELHRQLPPDAQLRLDANAGLSLDLAKRWLEEFAICPIEYLEQPLPVDQFAAMQTLGETYATPIALDESIANLQSLKDCHDRGWTGIYVIKPAIVGSPRRLQQFMQEHPIDVVFSSVFETEIGYAAGLRLAEQLGCDGLRPTGGHRALGYGTNHWWM